MTPPGPPGPLWTCPRCDARLASRNLAHACGPHGVDGFIAGKGQRALALWNRLVETVQRCGPFDYAPAKTRVAFMVRVRFLAVTALSDRGMTFHLWLRQPVESPRFFRVDRLTPKASIHWVRVGEPSEIDDELRGFICMSYRIGTGEG
ncbi:MAG: DUF5655 domain-containing protein [Acidimicrobiia bacterium]